MNYRIQKNWPTLWRKKEGNHFVRYTSLTTLKLVDIKQHRRKQLTHILNILGCGKYKHSFKFFGGGEVLTDERPIPHDGRNLPLLFWSTIRTKNFILLGGIGTPCKRYTKILYSYLLPKAKRVVTRDHISYITAQKYTSKTELHHDFSENIIKKYPQITTEISKPYILINSNSKSCNPETIKITMEFCKQYPNHEQIFFPCDIQDDSICYQELKKKLPNLQYYDWTKENLEDSLKLFAQTTAGIWARLHFLLPLKLYKKPFHPLVYAEKIKKIIL